MKEMYASKLLLFSSASSSSSFRHFKCNKYNKKQNLITAPSNWVTYSQGNKQTAYLFAVSGF